MNNKSILFSGAIYLKSYLHCPRFFMLAVAASFALLTGACVYTDESSKSNEYSHVKKIKKQSPTGLDCPQGFGWAEGLAAYLLPNAEMPTKFSATASDCLFHQWSWESFVWATAEFNSVPRFMSFPTPDDLLDEYSESNDGLLRLSSRSTSAHNTSAITEGAGAIVEADGNMLVGPNGYPVYASVHMNESYFNTAKRNLIKTGDYQKQAADDYFDVGAAVFKATWYRLDEGEVAPAGAFTTQAEVPVLTVYATKTTATVATSGRFETVTVALVGLHVVGYVENHPEFLWATFEHNANAPMLPDNTFTPSASISDPNTYTFYKAGTPFSQVNIAANAAKPSALSYDSGTGKFSPVTNVVQENKTGGENNSPQGPANIEALNQASQGFLSGQGAPQSVFSHYNLIGTVWMSPNTYVTSTPNWQKLNQANAVGSVSLANSTAETFVQQATNTGPAQQWKNCFLCHNPTSYSFSSSLPKLANRRIAISHVLSEGTQYAVPNVVSIVPPWKEK